MINSWTESTTPVIYVPVVHWRNDEKPAGLVNFQASAAYESRDA